MHMRCVLVRCDARLGEAADVADARCVSRRTDSSHAWDKCNCTNCKLAGARMPGPEDHDWDRWQVPKVREMEAGRRTHRPRLGQFLQVPTLRKPEARRNTNGPPSGLRCVCTRCNLAVHDWDNSCKCRRCGSLKPDAIPTDHHLAGCVLHQVQPSGPRLGRLQMSEVWREQERKP